MPRLWLRLDKEILITENNALVCNRGNVNLPRNINSLCRRTGISFGYGRGLEKMALYADDGYSGILSPFLNDYLGAFLSGIAGAVWVGLNNWILLLPALVCILAGGKENLKWRTEIGLIISVYLVLCLK